MDGVLVINKPAGLTSSAVVLRVKRILGARKVGHTGTLDPLATGVLPLCINEGTKLAPFFLHCEKEYVATLRLGIETDTQDREGTVVRQTEVIPHDPDRILEVVGEFQGTVLQMPPMFSALKYKGTPLYRIARKGGTVPRQPREITVFSIAVLSCDVPFVTIQVRCSQGTYIRTLCADIGKRLSCGAHMVALQRVRNGAFHITEALALEEVLERASTGCLDRQVIPLSEALTGMPEVVVAQPLILKIRQGVQIRPRDIEERAIEHLAAGQTAKIVSADGRLVAVVERSSERDTAGADAQQLPVWKTLRTFMN
jgi:tRNA pseudouridine55 synthase